MQQGQQERESLRGKSSSERVSERVSERGFSEVLEVYRGFQRFSEISQRFSEIFQRFSEVFPETLSEADFPLRGSQSCCP